VPGGKRKRYRQFCGLARALDVLGERWTLLLVRELLLGPRRYTDLLACLPGLTTNLLAARLKQLEADGVVARGEEGQWQLTAWGAALEPAVMELARWGGRLLSTPGRGERTDLAWGLLSLKRRYTGGLDLVLGLEVSGRWYAVRCQPARLDVSRARPDRAAAVVHARPEALQAVLFGGAPLEPLLAAGDLAVDGDPGLLRAFLGALLPPPFAHRPAGWRANAHLVTEPAP
jgi:DNA-binding HxlR family transcriptional regulator